MNAVGNEQPVQPPLEPLTRREQEILEMLAEGLTAPEMADRLTLAVSSIRWYLQQIYGKLGVPNKRQAIARAYELGLIRSGPAAHRSPRDSTAGEPRSGPPLPTGIVTFLFTNIEGSTPLWEAVPRGMNTAIAIHHTLLREVIEANGGFVFQIIGDAFQAAFPLVTQAAAAVIEIQHRLVSLSWPEATGPLKVRMGLHTGPASLVERGGYAASHTLNRAARVMSAGHGGQILLSQEVKALLEPVLPAQVGLKDLGEQRMKGLSIPEHLYQLTAPGLVEAFPLLATATQHPHNLPPELTSFVGREREIARLKEHFADGKQHLVTLTGAGGTGKTRLALQLGSAVLDRFPDGVWLVELAPLSDPQLVVGTVAQCLGVLKASNIPFQETLANYLAKKHLLLILDNCEHLLQECSRLVDFLLRRCPKLALLATSREILNLAGEISYRVPSLSLPDQRQRDSNQMLRYEAVQLFLERARQVVPDFSLDGTNAAAVSTICRRLEGMPLAIELAAARMRMMPASQIATRLDDVFRLLTGGSRNMMPRQQTLKAAIDWSYALLSPLERVMLQRLSVFARSWTMEAAEQVCADYGSGGTPAASAAEAVCTGEGIEAYEVLNLLGGLVDKSLVQTYQAEGDQEQCTECYRMLETVRQYARDRLLESGGSEVTRDRHLSYYLKLGEQADREITGSKQLAWVNRLESELENLRLALDWSFGTSCSAAGRVEDGLRLSASLMWFWHIRDRDAEGFGWLQNLMKAAGVTAPVLGAAAERFRQLKAPETCSTTSLLVWIRAINAAARLSIYCQTPAAIDQVVPLLDEAINLCRAIGEPASHELAWALIQKKTHLHGSWMDHERADRDYQEILEICRRNGYSFDEAFFLFAVEKSVFDLQKCIDQYAASLAIFESLGETDMKATAQVFLAFWQYPTGDYNRSRLLLQKGLAYLKKEGDISKWCRWIIWQYFLFPEPANARLVDEALTYLQDQELAAFTVVHLNVLAETEWALGNYERAEGIARQVLDANQTARSPFISAFAHMVLGRCAFSQGDLANAKGHYQEMTASWGSLSDWNLWLPKASLDALAVLLAAIGEMDAAAKMFAAVDELYQVFLGWPLQRAIDEHDSALAAVRQELGEEAFSRACQAGKALSLVEAFEYGQTAIR